MVRYTDKKAEQVSFDTKLQTPDESELFETGQSRHSIENSRRKQIVMNKVRERVKERKMKKETYLTMFNVRGSPNYRKNFEE